VTNTGINSITETNDNGTEIQRKRLQCGDRKLFIKSSLLLSKFIG